MRLLLAALLWGLIASECRAQVRVPFSVVDSLKKYAGQRRELLTDDSIPGVLTISYVDGRPFGIWSASIEDSSFVAYQRDKGIWKATARVPFLPEAARRVKQTDINGDDRLDICIYFTEGKSGNRYSQILLYSERDSALHYNPDYELYNVAYDRRTQRVISGWFGGVHDCMSKEAYRVVGDKLILDQQVEYCATDNLRRATLKLYQGKRLTKTVTGSIGNVWRQFETAVWDSRRWPEEERSSSPAKSRTTSGK